MSKDVVKEFIEMMEDMFDDELSRNTTCHMKEGLRAVRGLYFSDRFTLYNLIKNSSKFQAMKAWAEVPEPESFTKDRYHYGYLAGIEEGRKQCAEESKREQEIEEMFLQDAIEREEEDGWIPHDGGKQPVDDDVMVEVRLRNGVGEILPAHGFNWGAGNIYNSQNVDIAEYRVIEPKTNKKETLLEYVNDEGSDIESFTTTGLIEVISEYLEREEK